ncbi:hypothetical protein GCM10025738_25950 [Microbacterium fluvii]
MNWGTIPDWIAAISTGGALILALVLFAKERSARNRQSIDDLITWQTTEHVREGGSEVAREQIIVHARNVGNRPVRAPLLLFPDRRGGYATQIISRDGAPTMIPPGEECRAVVVGQPRNPDARYVRLRASDGQLWFRHVDEHHYPNMLGQSVISAFLFIFERRDGASPRRQRQRAANGIRSSLGTEDESLVSLDRAAVLTDELMS